MVFRALHKHISPASILALVALVFAVTGGAYAASGGGAGGHVTAQVAKSKKKSSSGKAGPRGPQGPAGPAGAAGSQGPAGAAGAKGENGAAGSNGTNGKNGEPGSKGGDGTNGESVKMTALNAGECTNNEGGAKLEVGGKAVEVCNGTEGAQGAKGAEGSFKGMIALKTVLKGTWSVQYNAAAAGEKLLVSLSTGVPVEGLPDGAAIIWSEKPLPGEKVSTWEAIKNEFCLGTAATPSPPAAAYSTTFVCIYLAHVSEAEFGTPPTEEPVIETSGLASPTLEGSGGGEVLEEFMKSRAAGPVVAYGTWAAEAQ